jgi:hypoxanthine phosphoribosyltransferase
VTTELEFDVPTWNQVYDMLLSLADKIRKEGFKPEVIVGVSRGGWPPARILSDLLGNPNLANVKAEFYLGVAETKGEPSLTQPVSVKVAGKKVLIVDEVADTGKSLKLVRQHIAEQGAAELRIATIYLKPWSIVKPDYYEKETRHWIVFPWEIKETIRKIFLRKEIAKAHRGVSEAHFDHRLQRCESQQRGPVAGRDKQQKAKERGDPVLQGESRGHLAALVLCSAERTDGFEK